MILDWIQHFLKKNTFEISCFDSISETECTYKAQKLYNISQHCVKRINSQFNLDKECYDILFNYCTLPNKKESICSCDNSYVYDYQNQYKWIGCEYYKIIKIDSLGIYFIFIHILFISIALYKNNSK